MTNIRLKMVGLWCAVWAAYFVYFISRTVPRPVTNDEDATVGRSHCYAQRHLHAFNDGSIRVPYAGFLNVSRPFKTVLY